MTRQSIGPRHSSSWKWRAEKHWHYNPARSTNSQESGGGPRATLGLIALTSLNGWELQSMQILITAPCVSSWVVAKNRQYGAVSYRLSARGVWLIADSR